MLVARVVDGFDFDDEDRGFQSHRRPDRKEQNEFFWTRRKIWRRKLKSIPGKDLNQAGKAGWA